MTPRVWAVAVLVFGLAAGCTSSQSSPGVNAPSAGGSVSNDASPAAATGASSGAAGTSGASSGAAGTSGAAGIVRDAAASGPSASGGASSTAGASVGADSDAGTALAAGQRVAFPNGGSGLFYPAAGAGKHPAVILIPEWWGLTEWIGQDAERFAAQGYASLALDIYRGRATHDPGEAHELMRGLPEDRAMDDMKAAFDALAKRPDVDASRIGVVGWCMGGGYALAFAIAEPRLRAAVVNYGKLVSAPAKVQALRPALLGNFAGEDRGIAPADVRAFAAELAAAHKTADIKVFDGAKHAFMNPYNKDAYNEAAATEAWARIDAFLARTLAKPGHG